MFSNARLSFDGSAVIAIVLLSIVLITPNFSITPAKFEPEINVTPCGDSRVIPPVFPIPPLICNT